MEIDEDKYEDAVPAFASEHVYDCVICNQTTPSTEERPMLLVSLLQSTSGKFLLHQQGPGFPKACNMFNVVQKSWGKTAITVVIYDYCIRSKFIW